MLNESKMGNSLSKGSIPLGGRETQKYFSLRGSVNDSLSVTYETTEYLRRCGRAGPSVGLFAQLFTFSARVHERLSAGISVAETGWVVSEDLPTFSYTLSNFGTEYSHASSL